MLAFGHVHDIHGYYSHDEFSNLALKHLMSHSRMLPRFSDYAT
jgi:hypothetical protein